VPAGQPETVDTVCPNCGTVFRNLPSKFAGKSVKCKKCASMFSIGATPAAPTPEQTSERQDSDTSAEWEVGDVIMNLYEVTGILGVGGMGKVYRMRHRGWNMDLAVKSPKASILARAGGAANFERESETWVNMGLHPHTVSCYYVRRIGGIPRVFAEFVEGGSLADWIKDKRLYRGGPQTALKRILDSAIQFAWGLDYAHQQGLIHQDVKPANVMLTNDGQVKVTDFGLARARPMAGPATGDGPQQTMMVNKVGMTPAYASPEQASGKTLTRRTDLWSWGASVLEMFTGEVTWPFGTVVLGALDDYLEHGPEDPDIPTMPASLATLLRRCFKENADERPHDMQEVAGRLIGIYQETSGQKYPRRPPRAGQDTADSLNNRAVSLLDLGKRQEAERCWTRALKADPHHIETSFNQAMHDWKYHSAADDEVYRRMEEVGRAHQGSWRLMHLLGKMYLYFGDYDQAVEQLKAAALLEKGLAEIARDLALARCAAAAGSDQPLVWQEVADLFGSVASLGYEDVSVAVGRALAQKNQGQVQASSQNYQQAAQRYAELPPTLDEAVRRYLPGYEAIASAGFVGQIHDLAFSSDGRQVLAATDEKVKTWAIQADSLEGGPEIKLRAGELKYAALSRDRTLVAAVTPENIIGFWETETGRQVNKSKKLAGQVMCLRFSPDGTQVLVGTSLRIAQLWDVAAGTPSTSFEGHTMYVSTVAFDTASPRILTGSGDGLGKLWDMKTGRCLQTLEGHAGLINSVAFSPDGSLAATAGSDKTIRLWNLDTGLCSATFTGHTAAVTLVTFSPDGRYLLSSGEDRSLRYWNVAQALPESLRLLDKRVDLLAFSPTLQRLMVVQPAGHAVNTKSLTLLDYYSQAPYPIPHVVTMPVSATEVDALAGQFAEHLEAARKSLAEQNHEAALKALKEARAVPGFERSEEALTLWRDLATTFPRQRLQAVWEKTTLQGHAAPVNALAFHPDGRRLLSAARDNSLRLWDIETGQTLKVLEGHQQAVNTLAIDLSGERAVSGSLDKTVRVWNLAKGELLHNFEGHTENISAVAISPDGRYVLSAGRDATLRLWDLNTRKQIRQLEGHQGFVTALAFSPDGLYALSGGWDKTLRVWDLSSGLCVQALEGHSENLTAVVFSPDGLYAASGSSDKSIRTWALKSGTEMRTLRGHDGPVNSVDFSPDGRYLVSASEDKTVRLWEIATGACLNTIEGHTGAVAGVAFSPDGHLAASAGQDKTIRVWNLDWEPQIREFADWNEGARPHLNTFLARKTPYLGTELKKRGRPQWDAHDQKQLLVELARRGFGWLKPEGIDRELKRMVQDWNAPRPMALTFAQKLPSKPWYDHPILLLPVKYWKLTTLAIVVLVLFFGVVSLFKMQKQDAPMDFRGLTLDMSLGDIPGLEKIGDSGQESVFRRPGDELDFEGLKLSEIRYYFYDYDLRAVRLYLDEDQNPNNLVGWLANKYGRPRQSYSQSKGIMTYLWNWKSAGVSWSVIFDMDSGEGVYAELRYTPPK
jgi:predicted Zn finger-like uncharacterized protein